MFGAVIGDIVGSRWEFRPTKDKNFVLFSKINQSTDDSILTVAVADALLNNLDPAIALRDWAKRIKIDPAVGGYGSRFRQWLAHPVVQPPYNSYGNGAAMRVSPAGFLAKTLDEALAMSDKVTGVTHNHPEGIKGARATVHAIFMARRGVKPHEIRAAITATYGYDMTQTVDEIRPEYRYRESCQKTVPQALTCALEATDFEDAIRNAVSLGGDADTLAAIAGALAEALFGIPENIATPAWDKVPQEMRAALHALYAGDPLRLHSNFSPSNFNLQNDQGSTVLIGLSQTATRCSDS